MLRWRRLFPDVPPPIRFRGGLWWTLDMDFVDTELLNGGYETAELTFVSAFTKPGMTVLDIGAHRGLHTALLSKRVGRRGRVFSFEPSPRNIRRLKLHRAINRCWNVEIKDYALGEENGVAELYEVPAQPVLNSLRPPDTDLSSCRTSVSVRKLDDVLLEAKVERVDFIKLDVEGGEFGVLKGAERLLEGPHRPVILCEVLDLRTRPWGYAARLIIEHLLQRGFVWFDLNANGELLSLETERSDFSGNFVAVPKESLHTVADLRPGQSAAEQPSQHATAAAK
ncbi:MAG TPA: FkbM family methyltransferase [Candidatus Acidoferrales bacterium]|nr:FkbM family methyltransferase [Candidatus Acidoferrales bacterium]HEV3482000.1 FkbM family methyltransferase [Candidatus Acidoferrales bacterium]